MRLHSRREQLIPLRHPLGLGIQHRLGIAFDLDRIDRIALLHRIDDFNPRDHAPEYGVLAVQPALVLGPAFAIDSTPRSCGTPLLVSSSNR